MAKETDHVERVLLLALYWAPLALPECCQKRWDTGKVCFMSSSADPCRCQLRFASEFRAHCVCVDGDVRLKDLTLMWR